MCVQVKTRKHLLTMENYNCYYYIIFAIFKNGLLMSKLENLMVNLASNKLL